MSSYTRGGFGTTACQGAQGMAGIRNGNSSNGSCSSGGGDGNGDSSNGADQCYKVIARMHMHISTHSQTLNNMMHPQKRHAETHKIFSPTLTSICSHWQQNPAHNTCTGHYVNIIKCMGMSPQANITQARTQAKRR